ncbi:cell division protein FtsK [Fodinicola feengrottensis]|uniref:cell division protein FtsK n=1 Tax=Fodinicola feengrottensis TaxID=435914 RepID=UPI0013D50A08|nr:cell division protein FtsK [Fodinicola feengrottensis]
MMANRPPFDDNEPHDPYDDDTHDTTASTATTTRRKNGYLHIADLEAAWSANMTKEPPRIPAQRDPDDTDDPDDDPDLDSSDGAVVDRESVLVGPVVWGGARWTRRTSARIWGPGGAGSRWRGRSSASAMAVRRSRPPIIPAWLRSRADLAAAGAVGGQGHPCTWWGYHAVRLPKYVAKTTVYAPLGATRALARLLRWASAQEGNAPLRQWAADHNDPVTWLNLDRRRVDQSRFRWIVVVTGALAAVVGGIVFLYVPIPDLARWAFYAVMALAFARSGRPADKPILDRVSQAPKYRKLTAELVRRGLTSIQLAGINQAVGKDPAAISFPLEIHRDGPGHLAVVDLPFGVEAGDVIARRGRLASALRLPLDQVWPEPDRAHTGRLRLWVGDEPASAMAQPAWPLAHGPKVDVFAPFPFANDPRLRNVDGQLIARSWLFGGRPGSGKTGAMRVPVFAAGLDPRVEIRGYELKGVGDFKVLEPILSEYGNGFDDDTIAACAQMLVWLYAECQRRSKRIDFYHAKGMAPENKVTAELASLKGSGLHPLLVFIDEIQELITHPAHGKKAGELLEKIIKLCRALGVTLLIGTQIPDKGSLPPGITRNVNTRFCLAVGDQIANDMILGTSMYRQGYRATAFEPDKDAGWGITVGFGKPGTAHAYEKSTRRSRRRSWPARSPTAGPPAPCRPRPSNGTRRPRSICCTTTWPPSGQPVRTGSGTKPSSRC